MAWNLANNYQSLTQRATLGTVNKALGDLKQSRQVGCTVS